jgi:hypothetical protein
MNNTKKLIFTLLAGATLVAAAPVFADVHDRGYDHDRRNEHSRDYDRRDFRAHDRYAYRGYEHRPVVVERPYYVGRPVIVEQPAYYGAPAMGPGALIGQALGSIYDSRQ